MDFGANLKKWREKKGISQRALAETTGISDTYLNQLENGERSNPSMVMVSKIADALGVSVNNLMK